MADRLAGKTALITGAGSGIGEATARRMAAEGANVVVTDRDGDQARRVADDIVAAGSTAMAFALDVTSEDDHQRAMDGAVEAFGSLDVFHANAGAAQGMDDADVANTPMSAWRLAVDVDLIGVATGIRLALPHMTASGGGSIVITASAAPLSGNTMLTAYASAKGGVLALNRYVATSHGRHGIRCNAIAPGLVLSPGAREVFPLQGMLDAIERHQTVPGFCSPDDVASLALFLASDESRFISGQTHVIDAGMLAMGGAVPDINEVFADLMAGS